jgi:zinc protease
LPAVFGFAPGGSFVSVTTAPAMRRLLLGSSFALMLGVCGCSTPQELQTARRAAETWAHERSDLKPDPHVLFGRLENGLRYAILPHAMPSGRASVNLLVQVGSYQERAEERGYAHFVEHLVFRGSAAFPGDSAVQALQQLGVAMGPDINAFTSFFVTDYRIDDLRVEEPAALATGLAVLRGWAGSATFDPAAVGAERGVVLSERRSRAAALTTAGDLREFLSDEDPTGPEIAAVYAHQRLADRMPIGTEATLNAATAEKLHAFYERWYRPERMIVTLAGDLPPAEAEKLIRQMFSDLAARGPAPAEPRGVVAPTRRSQPWLNLVEGQGEPAIQLSFCTAASAEPDSAEARRRQLIRSMALTMVLARLDHAAESEGATFTNTDSVLSHQILGQELAVIRVKTPSASWVDGAGRIDAELRRACARGFSESELGRQIRRQRAAAENEIYEFALRPAGTLARALAMSVAYHIVFTSAEEERRRIEAQLLAIKAADCNRAIRDLFDGEARTMAALGAFKDADAEAPGVSERLRRNHASPLPPYVDFAPLTFPYAELGPAGRVVSDVHDPNLDVDLIRFANGVRLNLKRTDIEPHRAQIVVHFGHGQLVCPPNRPYLGFGCFAWFSSGVGDLSLEQERAAIPELFGWDFSVSASSTEFAVSSAGAAGGAPFAIQDFAAHFAHPGIRPKAWLRASDMVHQVIAPYENTAGGVAGNALTARLTENRSLVCPNFDQVSHYAVAEFQDWFFPQLAAGPIEVSVVGDFDPQRMRDTVARTFGALPALTGPDEPPAEARRVKDPPPKIDATVAFFGPNESAAMQLAWAAPDVVSVEGRAQAAILASLLHQRLRTKLREEMGETYSPETAFKFNDLYLPSPTALSASIEAAPDRVAAVAGAARKTAEVLGHDGASAEEFERARQPLVFTEETNRRTNDWWLDLLETAQSRPAAAREKLATLANYRNATVGQINALARRLLTDERCSQVLAVPAATLAKPEAARAVAQAGHNDIANARAELRRRIEHAPAFVDLLARAGSVPALGLDEEALLTDAYIDLSGERFNRADYAGAISADNQVIALRPNEPVGYLNRGAAKAGLDDEVGAIADYTKALELNPGFVTAYTNRAEAELKLGRPAAAIADLTKAITLKPDDPDLYHSRSKAKEAAGDQRGELADLKAEIALRTAQRSKPLADK